MKTGNEIENSTEIKRNRKTVPKPENDVKSSSETAIKIENCLRDIRESDSAHNPYENRDGRAGVLKSSKKSREDNSAVRTVDVDYEYALLKKSL